jgi:SAM-dependent methyltransferase
LQDFTLRKYLETVNLHNLLRELGTQDIDLTVKEIKHFTEKEAEKRDKIVLSYFGSGGVRRIVDAIVTSMISPSELRTDAYVLDMGAGSGYFTTRVAHKLKKLLPEASFYAMDATPAMLLALTEKGQGIIPFFGIAENIRGSIKNASKYAQIPAQFDAVFSTLMLHHCQDIGKVFQSLRAILKPSGKAVIVDLCTHTFTEFREEMGDMHLGFDLEEIKKTAKKVFTKVSVKKLPGICCTSSGRNAELLIATIKP